MSPEQKAVADVLRVMKPHPQSREFQTWQEWAHRLSVIVHNEPPAVVHEWRLRATLTEVPLA